MKDKKFKLTPQKLRDIGGKCIIFLLMVGLSYVVLFPLFVKVSSSLMSEKDLYDVAVALVPREFSLESFKYVLYYESFIPSVLNSLYFAICVSVCTVTSSTLVGYGLARFKFKGAKLCTAALLATMLVPSITTWVPMYEKFRYFDIFGIITAIKGEPLNLTTSVIPIIVLSLTCLGVKGGIHALLMRQYFAGVPYEISEAAHVDGANAFKTFLLIMLPMARSMMIVVFVLSFVWQWTDTYFINIFYGSKQLLPNMVFQLAGRDSSSDGQYYLGFVYANAAALIAIVPPLLIYVIFQRKIIGGIERAGLVG